MAKATTIRTPRSHQVRVNPKILDYLKEHGEHASDGLEKIVLQHKSSSNGTLAEQVANLEKELGRRDKTISDLKSQAVEIKGEIKRFKNSTAEAEAELESLRTKLKESKAGSETAQGRSLREIERLRDENKKLKAQSEEHLAEYKRVNDGLEEEITSRGERITAILKENEEKSNTIGDKVRLIDGLTSQVATANTAASTAKMSAQKSGIRAGRWKVAAVSLAILSLSLFGVIVVLGG